MIIGLSGYANSGKDTVATMMQYAMSGIDSKTIHEILKHHNSYRWMLEDMSGWEVKKWAGKLKAVASVLTGISEKMFEDREFKDALLGDEWGTVSANPLNAITPFEDVQFNQLITVREFLQKLGTDALRDNLHKDVWVNALMAEYRKTAFSGYVGDTRKDIPHSNWIITDTRFVNEAKAIKDYDGFVIRVHTDGLNPVNNHVSEVELDNWDFDYVIHNNGTLDDLFVSVTEMVKTLIK